jgi:lipoprotein-anchoring transpeptidase ErfK/SrfK
LAVVIAVVATGLLSGWTAGAAPAVPPAAAVSVTTAPAAAVGAAALVPGTPCSTAARACIDLSARRAWLIRGGVVQYGPVPITSGRAGFRTPVGDFRVTFKDIDHLSSIFNNAPMPYSVFFNGGIAFHQGSLSVPSHGCIHLSRAAARTFFASLTPGNVVQVRP